MNTALTTAFRQIAAARALRAAGQLLEAMADELEHEANSGHPSATSTGVLELLNEAVVNAIAARMGPPEQADRNRAHVWAEIRALLRLEATVAARATEMVRP